jgi:hypothetical protein
MVAAMTKNEATATLMVATANAIGRSAFVSSTDLFMVVSSFPLQNESATELEVPETR